MQLKHFVVGLTWGMFAVLPAWGYDWTGTLLNDNVQPSNSDVIVDESGKLVVYGTEGSWSGNHTKEQIFDGDKTVSSNYFDPPETVARAGGAWAGIGFTRPKVVTAIRVNCRSSMRNRLIGCLIQGATTSDFSDAVTIHRIYDDGKFGSQQDPMPLQFVFNPELDGYRAFSYFRIYGPARWNNDNANGSMCGNCTELEFYGYDAENLPSPSDAPAPARPQIVSFDRLNGTLNCFIRSIDQGSLYELQRQIADGSFEWVRAIVVSADTFNLTTPDATTEVVRYRVRASNPNGTSAWAEFALGEHKANLGTYIGTASCWGGQGNYGTKVYDGDMENFADASDEDTSANKVWFGQDFGEKRTITAIRYVRRRNGNEGSIVGATFQVADDATFTENVRTIHTISVKPPERTIVTVWLDEPVTTQYIRFHAADGQHGGMAEIEYSSVQRPTDVIELTRNSKDKSQLRRGVSVIYHGIPYQNREASNPRVAFDGNVKTCCDLATDTSWNNGRGVAFGVDLGEPCVITSAKAWSRESTDANNWGRLNGIVVYGSNDAENWLTDGVPLTGAFAVNGSAQMSEVTANTTAAYRYVFVRNPDPTANFWGNISELELYGRRLGKGGLVIVIY